MVKFPKISVVHNRLGYKSKSGVYPVYIRIYFRGKADFVKIDDVPPIPKEDWWGDPSQNLYVTNPTDNKAIVDLLTSIQEWSRGKVRSGQPISVSDIKKHIKGAQFNETFNEFIDRFIKEINQNKSESEKLSFNTIKTYRSFETRFNEFRSVVHFDEVSPYLVQSFERFLAVEHNQKGVSRNKHLKKFKVICKAAEKEGLLKYNYQLLFDDIHVKEEKSNRVSLTDDEVRLLRDKGLKDPRDNYFKEVFLFLCLSGLYYSDTRQLKVSNVEEITVSEKGVQQKVLIITGNRIKNKEQYVTKLSPDAVIILEKYSNWPQRPPDDLLFDDLISDQKFNAKLKDIATELKINKNLTAKVGRHTFAELMISRGNDIKKVSGALGHQLASTTEGIYGRQSKANLVRGWIDFEL